MADTRITRLLAADLYQIDAPHFCAGLLVEHGCVWKAAPILNWAIGKKIDDVIAYSRRKRWTIAQVFSH